MRIRCAGLVEIDGGYAFMHRLDVKKSLDDPEKPYGEYFVFPGGGVEGSEDLKEATRREILEEFGIEVEVENELFYREIKGKQEEYVFKCKYKSGVFGTGTGPEFSGDPKYVDRGKYIPTIVSKEEIKNINLIPECFKDKLVKLIEDGVL